MNISLKNFSTLSKVVFGCGRLTQLGKIITLMCLNEHVPSIFLLDDVDVSENNTILSTKSTFFHNNQIIFISSEEKPKTTLINCLLSWLMFL